MRLSLRLALAGWGLDLDIGRTEQDDEPREQAALSGGPIGFALPEREPRDDEED